MAGRRIVRRRTADTPSPPWADSEFDAERAWRLICNLRAELAVARKKLRAAKREGLGDNGSH